MDSVAIAATTVLRPVLTDLEAIAMGMAARPVQMVSVGIVIPMVQAPAPMDSVDTGIRMAPVLDLTGLEGIGTPTVQLAVPMGLAVFVAINQGEVHV